jgi:hypothetical protein
MTGQTFTGQATSVDNAGNLAEIPPIAMMEIDSRGY